MSEQKRLTRSTSDRVLGGVAGGLARYFDIDPTFVRLAFMVLALFNGVGAMIYMIMWLVVPDQTAQGQTGEDTVRANVEDMKVQARRMTGSMQSGSSGAAVIGLVLVGIGALFLMHEIAPAVPVGMIWPVLLIGIGAYLLFTRR